MKYREQRRPIDRTITLITPDGDVTAMLRDISSSGMKVTRVSLPMDAKVCIPLLGRNFAAHVTFSDGTNFGLKFERPLTKAEITMMINPGWSSGISHVQRYREL